MERIKQRLFGLETALLGVFIFITIWILVTSFQLNTEASKLFPRLSAGIVLLLLTLLLMSKFLPDDVLKYFPEKDALTYGDDESEEFDESSVLLVFLMFGGYIVSVYLIGFFISTPLYVFANMQHFGYGDRRKKLLMTGATLVIVSIAYEVFRIPVDQGVLFEMLL